MLWGGIGSRTLNDMLQKLRTMPRALRSVTGEVGVLADPDTVIPPLHSTPVQPSSTLEAEPLAHTHQRFVRLFELQCLAQSVRLVQAEANLFAPLNTAHSAGPGVGNGTSLAPAEHLKPLLGSFPHDPHHTVENGLSRWWVVCDWVLWLW